MQVNKALVMQKKKKEKKGDARFLSFALLQGTFFLWSNEG